MNVWKLLTSNFGILQPQPFLSVTTDHTEDVWLKKWANAMFAFPSHFFEK